MINLGYGQARESESFILRVHTDLKWLDDPKINSMKPVESATIFFEGEKNAGIAPTSFNVELFIDLDAIAEGEQKNYLEEIRQSFLNTYELIVGERGFMRFDFEIDLLNKKENDLLRTALNDMREPGLTDDY